MDQFIRGLITMGFSVISLYFLRFWKETGDRLFLLFCCSFFILAINRLGLAVAPRQSEAATFFYILRFLGFLLLIVAIIDKNRSTGQRR